MSSLFRLLFLNRTHRLHLQIGKSRTRSASTSLPSPGGSLADIAVLRWLGCARVFHAPCYPTSHAACHASMIGGLLNGIFWVLRFGAPWPDLPERYGLRNTCYNRFVRWWKAGVWDQLMDAISAAHDGAIQIPTAPPFRPTSRPRRQKRALIFVSVDRAAGSDQDKRRR